MLDVAKDYAARAARRRRQRRLATQLGLLGIAIVLAVGMMIVVSRRVTGPLLARSRMSMLKLAGGDLTAEVSFGDRKDEIGALPAATQAFKSSMVEADRLRAEQKEAEARGAAQRKEEMRKLADEFQAAVGNIVGAVSGASGELEAAARTLTKTAESDAAACRHGDVGLGGSLEQCAVGRDRHRGADRLGRRDRAPGAGVEPHRRRSRDAGARGPMRGSWSCRVPQAASATW